MQIIFFLEKSDKILIIAISNRIYHISEFDYAIIFICTKKLLSKESREIFEALANILWL